jgi:predicted NUDIX family phosphoesterase
VGALLMSKIAHIVAIAADSLADLGFGISDKLTTVDNVLDKGEAWIGPRQRLEQHFGFVQPIPYIVIKNGDKFLAYKRGGTGGEDRLHSKVSIGFGGHVDLADAVVDDQGVVDLRKTMNKACVRELEEELGISLKGVMPEQLRPLFQWTHVIQSDASPVDRVHIGLVAQIDVTLLPGIDPSNFEDVIENAYWSTLDGFFTDGVAGLLELETWSALVLKALDDA